MTGAVPAMGRPSQLGWPQSDGRTARSIARPAVDLPVLGKTGIPTFSDSDAGRPSPRMGGSRVGGALLGGARLGGAGAAGLSGGGAGWLGLGLTGWGWGWWGWAGLAGGRGAVRVPAVRGSRGRPLLLDDAGVRADVGLPDRGQPTGEPTAVPDAGVERGGVPSAGAGPELPGGGPGAPGGDDGAGFAEPSSGWMAGSEARTVVGSAAGVESEAAGERRLSQMEPGTGSVAEEHAGWDAGREPGWGAPSVGGATGRLELRTADGRSGRPRRGAGAGSGSAVSGGARGRLGRRGRGRLQR